MSNGKRKRCELRLSIAQNAHDEVILEAIANFLNINVKIVNNLGKDSTVKRLDIYKLDVFQSKIVPIFDQYPLLTAKQADYIKWKTVLDLMLKKAHLSDNGFTLISELTS